MLTNKIHMEWQEVSIEEIKPYFEGDDKRFEGRILNRKIDAKCPECSSEKYSRVALIKIEGLEDKNRTAGIDSIQVAILDSDEEAKENMVVDLRIDNFCPTCKHTEELEQSKIREWSEILNIQDYIEENY